MSSKHLFHIVLDAFLCLYSSFVDHGTHLKLFRNLNWFGIELLWLLLLHMHFQIIVLFFDTAHKSFILNLLCALYWLLHIFECALTRCGVCFKCRLQCAISCLQSVHPFAIAKPSKEHQFRAYAPVELFTDKHLTRTERLCSRTWIMIKNPRIQCV